MASVCFVRFRGQGLDGVRWDSTLPTQVQPIILTILLGARVDKSHAPIILRNPNPNLRVSELVTQRHKYVWVWAPELGKMKLCLSRLSLPRRVPLAPLLFKC